jgi:sigma-B regulation protein RsbU (phosphoserine phosphatase)
MQKPALLKIVDQFGVKKSMRLEKRVFTIGRRPENDLVLLSSGVSRDHGAIVYDGDHYYLVDKGSKSGLFVNGQPITRCELHHLDKIAVGGHDDCQIEFIEESASVIFSSPESLNLSQSDSAPGISANEELQRLARYVEINQAFKFSLTPDDVLCLIVDAAIEMAKAERGCLLLKNEAGQLEFKIARDSKRNLLSGTDFQMSQTVVAETFKENRTVVVTDCLEDNQGARQSVYNLNLRSIVCVPLRHFRMNETIGVTSILKHDTIGVLYVDSRHTRTFSKSSLTLLESLAFEASKSLESVRLMQEEQGKKRLEHEFATAREVQVALLPTSFVQPAHFEVAAHSVPCRYVGGDFYDLLTLEDGRAALLLGDVSGKGISAALLASMAQGIIQALFDSQLSLSALLTSLNRVLVRKSDANRFITLFCALIDPDGTFTFANAGHNPAILVRANGKTELLSTGSMLLGAFEDVKYQTQQTKLGPGDVVVIFSDGVTEAVNAANQVFGDMRLEQLVRDSVGLRAKEIKDRIEQEVLAFTRGLPQGDDITLIALKMRDVDQFAATLAPSVLPPG